MYVGLQALRAKIRGFHVSGETIQHRISKSHGWKRNKLWCEKRRLGKYNREHLIAYGLLRDVQYERIERCAPENVPETQKIFEIIQAHGDLTARKRWTFEAISTALKRVAS